MGAIMARLPSRFPGLRAVILAGAQDVFPSCDLADLMCDSHVTQVRSLHIIGVEDRVVPPESSRLLAASFVEPKIIEHEQGHCIP